MLVWAVFSCWAGQATFTYVDATATQVMVAGEFNAWRMNATAMTKSDAGIWQATLELKPGVYEYKFVVDGDWDKANRDNRKITVREETADGEDAAPAAVGQSKGIARRPAVQTPVAISPREEMDIPILTAGHKEMKWTSRSMPAPTALPTAPAPEMPVSVPVAIPKKPAKPEPKKEPIAPKKVPPVPVPSTVVPVVPVQPRGTVFTYTNPKAKRVTVAGEFNDWNPAAAPMAKKEGGVFETTLDLKAGRYDYKFVVDGDWDKANKDNRVITVSGGSASPVSSASSASASAATSAAAAAQSGGKTILTLTQPGAKKVTVAGDFNGWNKDAMAMTKKEGGVWEAALDLNPGKYEYKFVVDGDWDKANKDNRSMTVAGGGKVQQPPVVAKSPAPSPAPQPAAPPKKSAGKTSAGKKKTDVTFRYKGSGNSVGIGAEFNGWKWESNLMTKGPDGAWTATIPLAPGEYAYKIVVDGDWRLDPATPLKKTVDGNENSMVRVSAEAAVDEGAEMGSMGSTDGVQPGVKVLPSGLVRFAYLDPSADQVFLSGSFNNWLLDAWPMMRRPDGLWVATIRLHPGAYTYKYVIGGVSKVDPANPKTREGGFGPDSLIEVKEAALTDFRVKVPFKVEAKKARRVTLAGAFNNWDPNAVELQPVGGGVWEVTVDLLPGRYDYKFLADGDWAALNKDNRQIEVK